MKYLSVCSGIEAATVAWHDMGWTPVAFSEIEKFPSQVLNYHYPTVPNVGDMTKFEEWNLESIDLLVGGTPCQSFSVAGLRKGLDDPRGNLMLTYGAIAKRFKPRWLVWENVPGVLSSNGGRDFGTFLGMLAELGYGFAYRVLDAQYFGVAQRRRRVFVVGCLGNWRAAAAVLFERDSLRRANPPSRKKGQATAAGSSSSVDANGLQITVGTLCADTHPGAYSGQDAYTGRLVPQIVGALTAKGPTAMGAPEVDAQHYIPIAHTLTPVGVPEVMSTLLSSTAGISRPSNAATVGGHGGGNPPAVAQPIPYSIAPGAGASKEDIYVTPTDTARTLDASVNNIGNHQGGTAVMQSMAVRRLTPVECERLQGFPDGYTNIRENCPDGPRYKALGNSMAVPVMRWIGQRIGQVNDL